MAAVAAADDIGVINPERRVPLGYAVAVLAKIIGRDMSGALARRRRAIMAADTIPRHPGMIENCAGPFGCGVAIIACSSCWNVVGRLAAGRGAVMATGAGPNDLRMIDMQYRRPGLGDVAIFAGIGGGDMVGVLAPRIDAIMATNAISRNAAMIERYGGPDGCPMAIFTSVRALHMV